MDNTPGMPVGPLDETARRAVTALLELALTLLRQDLRKPPAHPLAAERVALKRLSTDPSATAVLENARFVAMICPR